MRRALCLLLYAAGTWMLLMSILWSFIGFGPIQWDEYTHDFYLHPSKPEGMAQAASAAMALFVLGGTASPGTNPKREVGRVLIVTALFASCFWGVYAAVRWGKSPYDPTFGPLWDFQIGIPNILAVLLLGLWLVRRERKV